MSSAGSRTSAPRDSGSSAGGVASGSTWGPAAGACVIEAAAAAGAMAGGTAVDPRGASMGVTDAGGGGGVSGAACANGDGGGGGGGVALEVPGPLAGPGPSVGGLPPRDREIA